MSTEDGNNPQSSDAPPTPEERREQARAVGEQVRESAKKRMFEEAAEEVGGRERLNALLDRAESELSTAEIRDLQERLDSPQAYRKAVRDLELRLEPPEPGRTIRTRNEYFETVRRATHGDREARERLRKHRRHGGARFA